MKLNAVGLALAAGVVFGVYTLGFTLISLWTGYGASFLSIWVPLHPGYSISYLGAVVGFCYTFVEGFVWLWLTGTLYNYFVEKLE